MAKQKKRGPQKRMGDQISVAFRPYQWDAIRELAYNEYEGLCAPAIRRLVDEALAARGGEG